MSENYGIRDNQDEPIRFPKERSTECTVLYSEPWKLMIVDDEEEVHKVTTMVLKDFTFEGQGLLFLSAYSVQEAKRMIYENPDTALVLLDVVMETDNAGFELVHYIRDQLKNKVVQVVLRTGHPGQAPEQDVIRRYEINEYASKAELTIQRLFTIVSASLRSYKLSSSLLQLNAALKRELDTRIRAEKALKESEEKYRLVVDHANEGILMVQDKLITFCNPRGLEITGYSHDELTQKRFADLIIDEDRNIVLSMQARRIKGNQMPPGYVFRIVNKSGETLWIESNAVVVKWEGRPSTLYFMKDITLQKQLESQLRQAQKIEAIGTLAGGIAHDFNNILGAIIGYTEIACLRINKGDNPITALNEVLNAGERAKGLVSQILSFSRQDQHEQRPVQISSIIKETLKLLRASIPTTIEIHSNMEDEFGIVHADPTHIHQVLMNLCTNAAHAIGENGGVIDVDLKKVSVDASEAKKHLHMNPGTYLSLNVKDTGPGMAPHIVERIFEPYFTTRGKGEGTGLGLSVVHGIVKNLGGAIDVECSPGNGTSFHVYLPRVEQPDKAAKKDVIQPVLTGHERILFVDDERALVDIGKKVLENLGYKVTTRTSSIDAFDLFRAQADHFDLVITDQTMPNMTGKNLAQEILKLRPDIPIILCTGFSETISKEEAEAIGFRGFVMKPVAMRTLAKIIREVFD